MPATASVPEALILAACHKPRSDQRSSSNGCLHRAIHVVHALASTTQYPKPHPTAHSLAQAANTLSQTAAFQQRGLSHTRTAQPSVMHKLKLSYLQLVAKLSPSPKVPNPTKKQDALNSAKHSSPTSQLLSACLCNCRLSLC